MSESIPHDPRPATDRLEGDFDSTEVARVVGRSFYRELRSSGYTPKELLVLCTELIALITNDVPVNGAAGTEVRAGSGPV